MSVDTQAAAQQNGSVLCKACGLCCTGHLFSWAKLKSTELKTAAALGLTVLGSEPGKRGFDQPCPLWDGDCTVYTSPHYPHFCRLYKCSLLKKVLDQQLLLQDALAVVADTKHRIADLELTLPRAGNPNFRDRLLDMLEHRQADSEIQAKARRLLLAYKEHFGVKDFIDQADMTDLD